MSGEVISVNADLGDRPELVTSQRDDNADLLDASGYEATIA